MNFLLLSYDFMPLPLWGAGTSSAAITGELVTRGHKVTVISTPMDRSSGKGSYKGASVIRTTGQLVLHGRTLLEQLLRSGGNMVNVGANPRS
ncbi:MAG: hypothetical protein C7B43_21590 [Sulfobacillus benefaciens]|uniref:Uncharacterized protein n=1 Tax=Sulfobacillus benefaciens TaxID=453960 RepID=A0A2T2WFG0_9FIRM|nr:MAG: hypothetical protein C7B43_21590 [Sulfobacillus benefaciens]HBQ95244.1 hypothetical protein [Sulfobacillus sp.]